MPQPKENSPIKRDILFRVHLLYAAFVLIAALVFARLIWVQLFSSEVAYNAERLEGRIFTDEIIPARRGNILTRDGEPLATSLFRYQVEMDYGSPGFDSLRTFREQSDSLAKLLALYFRDKSAAAYAQAMQREHARRYRVTYRKDTLVPRSEGGLARWWDRMRGEEFLTVKLYDTLRDHTPVALFPREIDYTEWQTLRRYPILNWNMGMTYRLRERDERVYPQGELARRTIGQVGDKGNYGVEYVLRDVLEGRDGKARRQRIARGFYGRVVGGDNSEPERRAGRGDDARPGDAGCRRPRVAPPARSAECAVGYGAGHGGRHGRPAGDGQPFAYQVGRLRRGEEPRPVVAYGAGVDLQARGAAGAGRRCGDVARRDFRHRQRRPREGGAHDGAGFARAAAAQSERRRRALVQRLFRPRRLRDLQGRSRALCRLPAPPAPRPHGRVGGVRRRGPDLPRTGHEDLVPRRLDRQHGLRLCHRTDAAAYAHALQRRGQRRLHGRPAARARNPARRRGGRASRTAGAGRQDLLLVGTAQGARVPRRGRYDWYGQAVLPRYDALQDRRQDRYGAVRAGRDQILRRLLPRYDGALLSGRRTQVYGAHGDVHPPRTGYDLLRGRSVGTRRAADRQLHLQPSARVVRPRRRDRRCALRPHGQGGRHRPDPRGGGRTDAPRGERAPFGLGAHARRFARQGDGDAACGRPAVRCPTCAAWD